MFLFTQIKSRFMLTFHVSLTFRIFSLLIQRNPSIHPSIYPINLLVIHQAYRVWIPNNLQKYIFFVFALFLFVFFSNQNKIVQNLNFLYEMICNQTIKILTNRLNRCCANINLTGNLQCIFVFLNFGKHLKQLLYLIKSH